MEETPNQEFEEFIDWSKVDLLDACSDPMLTSVGLNRQTSASNTESRMLGLRTSSNSLALDQPLTSTSIGNGLSKSEMSECHPDDFTNSSDVNLSGSIVGTLCTKKYPHCLTCDHCVCDVVCYNYKYFMQGHAKSAGHHAFGCRIQQCTQTFLDYPERDAHEKRPHVTGHCRIQMPTTNDCIECQASLPSKADLLRHSSQLQHQPYGCECGARFSRLDVLNRHLESFGEDIPKYPCPYCKRHRGSEGFKRRDHLTQHIRNYHHLEIVDERSTKKNIIKYSFPVCPHAGCPEHRDGSFNLLPRGMQMRNKPFETRSAYTQHIREKHNECSFPCDISGCDRVGRKGYFREKDLLKHRREKHPDAAPYPVSRPHLRIPCTEPFCGAILDPTSLKSHMKYVHRWWSKTIEEIKSEALPSLSHVPVADQPSIPEI